jgi:Bacteriophage tail sheath protein
LNPRAERRIISTRGLSAVSEDSVSEELGRVPNRLRRVAPEVVRGVRKVIHSVRVAQGGERGVPLAGSAGEPIVGVDTSTAAFVGAAVAGAPIEPVELTSFADYEGVFGKANDELGRAVSLFFENDGTRAYAVRSQAALADGLRALEGVPFALLALPDASALAADEAVKVAGAAMEVCARRRAFLLVDPPASLAPTDVPSWTSNLESRDAAVYVPRLRLPDGSEAAASGAVAGVFARTDRDRGVWKAPAGSSATVRGVADVTSSLSEQAVDGLTALRINVVRRLPTGLAVWGAQTLSSDPEWRYVNVRRLALFIERSIDEGTQWVTFEPNSEPLWNEVRRRIEEFMLALFNQGAFAGTLPETAYFVRCDRTTMTQDDIDNGRLLIFVQFARARPVEFVVLRVR